MSVECVFQSPIKARYAVVTLRLLHAMNEIYWVTWKFIVQLSIVTHEESCAFRHENDKTGYDDVLGLKNLSRKVELLIFLQAKMKSLLWLTLPNLG